MGKQLSSVNVAKTMLVKRRALDKRQCCFGEAICFRIPLRIQIKMEPQLEAECVFLGKLDQSDEVIVGIPKGIETTRSFRQMPADQQ